MSKLRSILVTSAAVGAAAISAAAIAGAATTPATGPPGASGATGATGAQGQPPFNGAPHGSAAHESAEKAVSGADATKAQAAAVKLVGSGTAGPVTSDFSGSGFESTVTKADGSTVEVHLDSAFNAFQGGGPGDRPGGPGGPPGGGPAGYAG